MRHAKDIEAHSRLAQELEEDRKTLLGRVPFGSELERSPSTLGAVAQPSVALVGAGATGLLQALTSPPPAEPLPWQWGEADAQAALLCLLATPALQPLPLSELTLLSSLAERFPADALAVVLTRVDELPTEQQATVKDTVRQLLDQALPERKPKLFPVAAQGAGLEELHTHVASTLYTVQKERLRAALGTFKTLLEDMESVLGLRELAGVRPETVQRVRTRMDTLLLEEGSRLRTELRPFIERLEDELARRLPAPQRDMVEAFQQQVKATFEPRVVDMRRRLDEALMAELSQDLPSATTVKLADRFSSLMRTPSYFDWKSARTGGLVGAGAGALLGARVGPMGALIGGLLGGLVGGLVGRGSTVDTPEALKERIAEPFLHEAQERLTQGLTESREDLTRFCRLLEKATDVFSRPEASTYDMQALHEAVRLAGLRLKHLEEQMLALEVQRFQEAVTGQSTQIVLQRPPPDESP